jgi:hypothetical protein
MKKRCKFSIVLLLLLPLLFFGQVLELKQGNKAILKKSSEGNGIHLDTLPEGTKVLKIGDFPHYHAIQTADGTTGYSYKGNFQSSNDLIANSIKIQSLLANTDVLKISIMASK